MYQSPYTGAELDESIANSVRVNKTNTFALKQTFSSGFNANLSVVSNTGDYAVLDTDQYLLISCNAADATVSLLAIASAFRMPLVIKKMTADNFDVVITPSAGETIEGSAEWKLKGEYEMITIIQDGASNWIIVGR